MPKNDADPKYDRKDNKADKKDNQHNFTEDTPILTSKKDADYVPSLNGIPKS